MENSRKFPSLNNSGAVPAAFERALGDILARVSVCALDQKPCFGIALSGGLDSSVLLHLSAQYAKKHAIAIQGFHVHHGFSPNADAWEVHCRQQCEALEIPFASTRVNVNDIGDRGLEEAARIARYKALHQMCRKQGVPLILMAHHLDDQAETVMLQLLRGSGLPGLSGMPLYQPEHRLLGSGLAVGRPLLELSRSALEDIAGKLNLQYVRDESNEDIAYKRNALRQLVFPAIEMHFPGCNSMLARAAVHLQSAQALLTELAMLDLAQCQADDAGKSLSIAHIKAKALSQQRIDNLLRHWLYAAGVQMPSTSRLDEIRIQMLTAESDKHPYFDFGSARLHRVEDRLELHPHLGQAPEDEIELRWSGEQEVQIPQWRGKLIFAAAGEHGLSARALKDGVLTVRARSGQEKLKLADNRPSKSLKNLFQEQSIPPWQRKWSPTLYLDNKLVFVANLGTDVRYHVRDDAVSLRWEFE